MILKFWEMPPSMRSVCILHGDPEKGADLLDSREDLGLLGSDCAAYYALVLSACGRGDEARQVLAAVDRPMLRLRNSA